MHRLTAAQHVVGVAGGDMYLDFKAVLRDEPAVDEFTATVDSLTAGGTIDLLLQHSTQETGAAASSGVRVTTLNESDTPNPPGVKDKNFKNFFRDDTPGTTTFDLGAFGGTEADRDSTYDFRNLDAEGERTLAGLVAGTTNGNIIVTAAESEPDDVVVSVLGITEILGTGHIDVLTNGFVTLTELTGDMRVGSITSTANDVTLTAPESIVDALADAAADVTGVNITLTAVNGGIGNAGNFLETNLLDDVAGQQQAGVLKADAPQNIYIEETEGDLRVHHVVSDQGDVTLVARNGSIVDGNDDLDEDGNADTYTDADGRTRDAVNVTANNVNLDANGGSVGAAGDDLDIDTGVTGGEHTAGQGQLFSEAVDSVFITEVNDELNVVAATADDGKIRLTVPDTSAVDTENLVLLGGGAVRVAETGDRVITVSEIAAAITVALWVGDTVVAASDANSRILAGTGITIRGDTRRKAKVDGVESDEVAPIEADDGRGTRMTLRGTIGYINAPADVAAVNTTAKDFTQIFGHDDIDTFRFEQTKLDANTTVYGSWDPAGSLANDGEDRFIVNQLRSMHVNRGGVGDTLTLDGQADTDYYTVQASGSQANLRNYVVNVLDTGGKDDGVDELLVLGADSQSVAGVYDDLFLLRGMSSIPDEASESPAFVAALHASTLAQAQAGTGPGDVERVNYDANLNGRLIVEGRGGNDYFAVDDNSVITTLDGGAGDDGFQVGQIFGTQRDASANIASTDVFGTVATTRGYLSRGTSAPLVAEGGSGDDVFQVYSNQAELRLEGDDGNDLFIVRAFALAETNPDGTIKTENGVAVPKGGFSTASTSTLRGGVGNDLIEYNVNAPVSVDGGAGFDKVLVLGTEFGDSYVITDQGVFGAGCNVTYENIEVLEIDGLEGDDRFTVQSTSFGVATRVVGGEGNDTFNVAGDVTDVITTQELEGQSAIINHEVAALLDPGYDGMIANGINLNVAGLPSDSGDGGIFSGNVIIEESEGSSLVRETATGEWGTVDSYTVRLAVAPAAGTTVYVTVSAARSPQEEQEDAGKGDSVLVSTSEDFVRDIILNGDPTTVRNRAVVLVFDSSNWDKAKTVYVAAANDEQEEGKRTIAVSHSVQAVVTDASADTNGDELHDAADDAAQADTVAAYRGIKVRNVMVEVIDNDTAGILLTEVRADAYDNGTLVLEGAEHGITDQYKVELTKAPTAAVTVHLDYEHSQLSLSQDTITFDASNWNQPVTISVTAVDDTLREDRKLSVITHTTSSADAAYEATVSEAQGVSVVDNDVPGVLVQQSDGQTLVSPGVTDTYTVRLTNAPIGAVTITPLNDGLTTESSAGLTFDETNWWIPQVVTVSNVTITDPDSPLLHPGKKQFAVQPHLLSDLKGPLEIEGGVGAQVHPLIEAVVLPAETNQPVFAIAPQPPEAESIDMVNVYDDSSQEDKHGALSGTQLTGSDMSTGLHFAQTAFGESGDFAGGITYGKAGSDGAPDTSNIEVFNLLMGSGNDWLDIHSTLNTSAIHGGLTTVHGGGNMTVQPGVAGVYTGTIAGDTIMVDDGGGPASPLVVYGDTSQDASWYAGRPYDADVADTFVLGPNPTQENTYYRLPRANPFDLAGDDLIDASADTPATGTLGGDALGIVIYGGAGDDTIYGTQIGDVLAGGSGNDTIRGQSGDDRIYGDSGVNVDVVTRILSVPTTDAVRPANDNLASNRDNLVAGRDRINGNDGNDIIFGDHGVVAQQLPDEQKILNVRKIEDVRTDQPGNGDDDQIHGDAGRDRIFGGNGSDQISGDADADVIFGDQGHMSYVAADYFRPGRFRPDHARPG